MGNKDKWETLHHFKCAFHGPKEKKKEEPKEEKRPTTESIARVIPPPSPKPPPMAPLTLGNDRRDEKGEGNGGKGTRQRQRQRPRQRKDKTKERSLDPGNAHKRGGKSLPYAEEDLEQKVSIRDIHRENNTGGFGETRSLGEIATQ